MRKSTIVHAAFRNIGDSQDVGDFFEGSVSEAVLWIATKLAQTSIATRIVIGIGRNKDDAGKGIDVKGAGQQVIDSDMKSMLDSIFAEKEEMEVESMDSQIAQKVDGDDYESN